MADADLDKKFNKAVWLIRNGPKAKEIDDDTRLEFYGFFKQATEGDCTAKKPWIINPVAYYKWEAWHDLLGMESDEAKRQYVALLAKKNADWENHPALQDYKE